MDKDRNIIGPPPRPRGQIVGDKNGLITGWKLDWGPNVYFTPTLSDGKLGAEKRYFWRHFKRPNLTTAKFSVIHGAIKV